CGAQPVDELDLVRRRDRIVLVLQPVARTDLDDGDHRHSSSTASASTSSPSRHRMAVTVPASVARTGSSIFIASSRTRASPFFPRRACFTRTPPPGRAPRPFYHPPPPASALRPCRRPPSLPAPSVPASDLRPRQRPPSLPVTSVPEAVPRISGRRRCPHYDGRLQRALCGYSRAFPIEKTGVDPPVAKLRQIENAHAERQCPPDTLDFEGAQSGSQTTGGKGP